MIAYKKGILKTELRYKLMFILEGVNLFSQRVRDVYVVAKSANRSTYTSDREVGDSIGDHCVTTFGNLFTYVERSHMQTLLTVEIYLALNCPVYS